MAVRRQRPNATKSHMHGDWLFGAFVTPTECAFVAPLLAYDFIVEQAEGKPWITEVIKLDEGADAVLARALPAILAIVEAHPDASVLAVSHKATIRLLLSSILGFDARGYRDRLDQAPACLNVLDFRDPVRARLMLFNDTSHYADQPREPRGNLSRWWDEQSR